MHDYPAEMPIRVLERPLNHTVCVPGSKSITNRALVLAALLPMDTDCKLIGALKSEDTEVMIDSLKRLGFHIETDWDSIPPCVRFPFQQRRRIPAAAADLFVANSGTSMRFLAAMVATGEGEYRLDGVPRMRERPIQDLLDALHELGVDARSENTNGCPPIVIKTTGLRGGHVTMKADVSSQFLSALLMAAPFADEDVIIETTGTVVSEPYIEMTIAIMDRWGFIIEKHGKTLRVIAGDYSHNPIRYVIEPDASAASYFFGAAAIIGGSISVQGMKRDMLQGDVRFVDCLEMMGCNVDYLPDAIRVSFDPLGGALTGIDVDMNAISDTVMTLAAVACFASSPTTIRNVAHIRHKETDRIAAIATELRKLGVEIEEYPDGLKITPRPMTGCALDTYNDHRMAMSLALIGLKVPGVVIRNPGCVAKTYPGFWQDFEKLYESAS